MRCREGFGSLLDVLAGWDEIRVSVIYWLRSKGITKSGDDWDGPGIR